MNEIEPQFLPQLGTAQKLYFSQICHF